MKKYIDRLFLWLGYTPLQHWHRIAVSQTEREIKVYLNGISLISAPKKKGGYIQANVKL